MSITELSYAYVIADQERQKLLKDVETMKVEIEALRKELEGLKSASNKA